MTLRSVIARTTLKVAAMSPADPAPKPKLDTDTHGLDATNGSYEDGRIIAVIVLLTLNAGWVDAFAFLSLGRVFASFLSGNFVFIGLGIVQGQTEMLVRALVADLAALGGSTFAALSLRRRFARRP